MGRKGEFPVHRSGRRRNSANKQGDEADAARHPPDGLEACGQGDRMPIGPVDGKPDRAVKLVTVGSARRTGGTSDLIIR